MQAFGGSLIGGSNSDATAGLDIYRAGIGLQEGFILLFCVLAVNFHRRMNHVENVRETNWRPQLYVEYAVLMLITVSTPTQSHRSLKPRSSLETDDIYQIRVIYRLSEYANGTDGYAPTHEWLFYVFDAAPMLSALTTLNAFHPGRFLVGSESEFPSYTRAEKKAMKQQKKAEKAAKKAAKKEEKLAKKEGRTPLTSSPSESAGESLTGLYRVAADGTVELEERNKRVGSPAPEYV